MITAWKQDRVGRSVTEDPGSCDSKEIVNAAFYENLTGCQWRYRPQDLLWWVDGFLLLHAVAQGRA